MTSEDNVSITTAKIVWARAAGRCSYLGCGKKLIISPENTTDRNALIGQMAHIVGRSRGGPRGMETVRGTDRDGPENLILLCTEHHTLIDQHREGHPTDMLYAYKDKHEHWVNECLSGQDFLWNIPYPRNPMFTGREDVLTQLTDALKVGQAAAHSQPQAICGLGGIGKTQIAVEYAYLHYQDYQAVLWTLADTRESLVSGYVDIAGLLNLPEKDEQDQTKIVQAVVRWLTTHSKWLLLLDNTDDLALVYEFLPHRFSGHLLLTTRAQVMGRLASRIEVDPMSQDVGTLFLLRRALLIARDALLEDANTSDIATAEEICKELAGLPLALDQAGAYIEEMQCTLSGYQRIYQIHRDLLLKRRGGIVPDHLEPIATTWSLSFERVKQRCPAAGDLLRLCAFLSPDAIPEEIVTIGAMYLSPELQSIATSPLLLNEAICTLRAYSLIHRNSAGGTFSVHRLVQAVLKDEMDEKTYLQWATYTVKATSLAFPTAEVNNWPDCQRYISHAHICLNLVEQKHLVFREAANLFVMAGIYSYEQGQYKSAEKFYEKALNIYEQVLGADDIKAASVLSHLGELSRTQGKHEEAEQYYKRALSITTKMPNAYSATLSILNNLAVVYYYQGKEAETEQLIQQVLSESEKLLGPEHPNIAITLHNQAHWYRQKKNYEKAEQLLHRALDIQEKVLGPIDPSIARTLDALATIYNLQQKNIEEVEPLYRRSLSIKEHVLGPEHPDIAITLRGLAMSLRWPEQGREAEAKKLIERERHILEQSFGPNSPQMSEFWKAYDDDDDGFSPQED